MYSFEGWIPFGLAGIEIVNILCEGYESVKSAQLTIIKKRKNYPITAGRINLFLHGEFAALLDCKYFSIYFQI